MSLPIKKSAKTSRPRYRAKGAKILDLHEKGLSRQLKAAYKKLPPEVVEYIDRKGIVFSFWTREHEKMYGGRITKKYAGGSAIKSISKRVPDEIELVAIGRKRLSKNAHETIIHEALHLGHDDIPKNLIERVSREAAEDGEALHDFARESLPPDSRPTHLISDERELRECQSYLRKFIDSVDDLAYGRRNEKSFQKMIYKDAILYRYPLQVIAKNIGITDKRDLDTEHRKFGIYLLTSLSDFYVMNAHANPKGAFAAKPYEESYANRVIIDEQLRKETFQSLNRSFDN